MFKALRDVGSTLYEADGCMSLFRLSFAFSLVMFFAIAVLSCWHEFNHFAELVSVVGLTGGYCTVNKGIVTRFKHGGRADDGGE